MRAEARIDIQREVEQGQNALLHRGERRQMPPRVPARVDDGQRHLLKRGQEALGRRLGRGPCGIPQIPADLVVRRLRRVSIAARGEDL